jgi:hypothetical protein
MGATTVEANSSHVIMLSQPDLVIDVIRKAAAKRATGFGKRPSRKCPLMARSGRAELSNECPILGGEADIKNWSHHFCL